MRIAGEAKSKITGYALRGVRITGSIDGHTRFETFSNEQGKFQYQDQKSAVGQRIRLRAERDDYQVDEQDHILQAGDLGVVIEMTPRRDDGSASATSINGLVRDAVSKQLLHGAQVEAAAGDKEIFIVTTNEFGEFRYEDRDGKYVGHTLTISATHASYKTQRFQKPLPAAGLVLDIELEPAVLSRPRSSRFSGRKAVIALGGMLMLALAVYFISRDRIPWECTGPGQEAFLNQSPAPADVVEKGEQCLSLIQDFGKDRSELLGAAVEYFRFARDKGSAVGALRHGELYDPNDLSPNRMLQQCEPDPILAFQSYQQARRLGSKGAEERLAAMRPYLEKLANDGNEHALSILGSWPE